MGMNRALRRLSVVGLRLGLGVGLGAAPSLLSSLLVPLLPPPAAALEVEGQTFFRSPPWKVDFANYYWYVMQAGGEYYFTVTLPERAGAGLGQLVIQQTRGVDRNFPYFTERTRAFFGRPRQEGAAIPVQAAFDAQARRMTVQFLQPPQPGQTVTVALLPVHNPTWSDTYMFGVQALPAGPNPVPASLGFVTMSIYSNNRI